jgi:hypothetical protein
MPKLPQRKKCSKCSVLKPLVDFPICKGGKHGVYNYCRECHAKYQKERYPNREEVDEKEALKAGLKKSGLKRCTSCQKIKTTSVDFYKDPRRSDGKQSHCKECFLAARNEAYILKEYGIALTDFQALMEAQDGCCAICGRAPKKNKFNIDHCHVTHRIRALLCVNCNTNLLPFVERFPQWVKQAFEYLENPPAFKIIGERVVPETNQARVKERLRKAKRAET